MSLVDDSLMARAPAASPAGGPLGDDFHWYCADPDPGYNPVTDISIGDTGPIGAEWIGVVIEHCT